MRLQELILVERVLAYKRKGNKAVFNYGPNNSRTMNAEIAHGRQGEGSYEVSFHPSDNSGADQYAANDAGGNELSIFQTVVAFVEEWYEENKESVNMLFAEPSINDKYTGKRHRLYTKMAERMAKKHGGSVKTNGQFVMWYPEKLGTQQSSDILHALHKLFSNDRFWEEFSGEGYYYKDYNKFSIELNDANLNNNLFELENAIGNDIELNVDSDVYYDSKSSGTTEKIFRSDAANFQNMLNKYT